MKKWSGGTLIATLVVILILRYSLVAIPSQKQSPLGFFKNYSIESPHPDEIGIVQPSSEVINHVNKPYLVTVEGLDDLYSRNLLGDGSSVKLVWPQMRYLLSRSDSLPGTTEGVREASIAWKDMVATTEEEKMSRVTNSSSSGNITKHKHCPFSLSELNKTPSQEGRLLEIPCGLIQDSSVTVVGIPRGDSGSFQIELVGSQLPGEPYPPIILHYNVCLQGDKLTDGPVIVQNTWTAEHKWDEEERCPPHDSTVNMKVDGLSCCSEKVGATFMEENPDGKQPTTIKWINGSRTIAQRSFNFPFIEGNPFTATLWVGLEGFHVTVNGKHITSFAYRESLEPWSVSGARVSGSLNVLSVLANGLPISEDLEIVADLEHLKAPPIPKKRILMLVGVFSTGNNFQRRMALRRSWMQYEVIRSGNVAVRFFVGLHKNTQVNLELWKEAQTYGDIQLMPFVDYYGLITLKTIAICLFGTKILPAKYIMKTDDDAFVRIDEVLSSLKEKPTHGLLYGFISFDSAPHRDCASKWYISTEEWPHALYPPWAHGPGYVISRDIAKFVIQGHQERNLKLFKLEDVAMGIWIEQFKKSGQEVHYINDERFHNAGCESNYILAHYQGPRLMLCLWEKLQKEHEPVCCE